jgi:hypothetical protein
MLVFNISFENVVEQDCCKSCVSYGDPEQVSFDGIYDKWIICDARGGSNTDTCRMSKDVCSSLNDHNNNPCVWLAGKKKDSRRWDVGLNGSPCVPDFSQGPAPRLSLLSVPSYFAMDITMGERGIIKTAEFDHDDIHYVFDADMCFDGSPFTTSPVTSATIIKQWPASGVDVGITWEMYFDDIYVQILCVRNVQKKHKIGEARLNIQTLTVPNYVLDNHPDTSGFCKTSQIELSGDVNPLTPYLHASCVANRTSALQACKHMVDRAMTPIQLEICAVKFCNSASLSDVSRERCLHELVPANEYKKVYQSTRGETKATRLWERYYCMSLVHLGMVDKRAECESMVASMGWPFALEKWGTARARHSNTVPICNNSTNLDDYRVEFKGPCDTGVFLDVWNGLEWVPTYFFKDDVCKDTQFVLHESEHPLLFEGSKIQFRQCDDVENVECVSNRCTPKAGVYISAEYMSVEARLIRLYNEGRLCECSDDTCTPFKK